MVATTGPNLGLIDNEDIGENWYTELTRLLRGVDGLVQPSAISKTVVTPPGSPSEGDTYIVGTGATGVWATHDGKIARYTTRNALNTWEFFTPKQNWIIGVEDEGVSGVLYRYTGTLWELLQTGGGASGGSAGGEKLYFSSTDYLADSAVTIGIDELTTSPTEASPVDLTQVVNNSTEMIGPAFLDGEIGSTTLSGGEWTFDWYRFVDSTTQVTNIITSVYIHSSEAGTLTTTGTGTSRTATVSGATPFVAGDVDVDATKSAWIVTPTAQLRVTGFTSSSEVTVECLTGYVNESAVAYSKNTYLLQAVSDEINDISVTLEEKFEVIIDTAVNATDKIMVRNWARTTANSDITVTLRYGGADHYSNIHTPIPFSHNNLRQLQGGTTDEYYHVTQNAAANAESPPFAIGARVSGLPGTSAEIIAPALPFNVTFDVNMVGSTGKSGVAATAQSDFDIKKNGASVGTMRFAASATTATFIMVAQTSFNAGDVLSVVAPSSQDATLADVDFILYATRTL